MTARALVVGFGSELAGDDAVGPATIALLRAAGPPPECRLEEGGCDGLVLAGLWEGEPEIWIVDALVRGAPPGTVHRLSHEAVLALPQTHAGAHQLSLPETLRCLRLAFPDMSEVRFRLWGIEPGRLNARAGLSSRVHAAVRRVAGEIRRTLATETRGSLAPR